MYNVQSSHFENVNISSILSYYGGLRYTYQSHDPGPTINGSPTGIKEHIITNCTFADTLGDMISYPGSYIYDNESYANNTYAYPSSGFEISNCTFTRGGAPNSIT